MFLIFKRIACFSVSAIITLSLVACNAGNQDKVPQNTEAPVATSVPQATNVPQATKAPQATTAPGTGKSPTTAKPSKGGVAPKPTIAPKPQTGSTIKEFPYLPTYKGMVLQNFIPAKGKEQASAMYNLSGVNYKDVLVQYENILKSNGWKTTTDKKPANITVKKGNHTATIVAVPDDKIVRLAIFAK